MKSLVLYSPSRNDLGTTGTWARAHVLFRMGGAAMDLEGLVRPVVEASGLEFVDVSLARDRGQRVLRVTVDRDSGVDLTAISEVSERISRRLDLEGFDPGPYSLEVSSPGVERPLRGWRDFDRQVGQQVKVKAIRSQDGGRVITGRVLRAGPEAVVISTEQGEREVAYGEISSARTVVDWSEEMARKGGRMS